MASMRRVVRCEEWGRLQIGVPGASLSFDEVGQIFRRWAAQTGTPPEAHFEVRGNTLTPKNWSGVAPGDDVQLEVIPMGASALPLGQLEILDRNISLMLQASLTGNSLELAEGELARSGDRLHVVLFGFCRMFDRARRKQVIRRYESVRAVTRRMRGRLTFPDQVLESIRRPGYFASEWVFLNEDTAENRFIKAVLLRFLPRASGNLRYRLEDLLSQIETVSIPSSPMAEWRRIRFDRLSKEYSELLHLGKSLLDDEAPGLFSGLASAATEIVFTARTFEIFMATQIAQTAAPLGYSVITQQTGQFLSKWEGGTFHGRQGFELIPDIQLHRTGKLPASWVIDTKWKRLKPELPQFGISLDDMYQVLTYAVRLRCSHAVLLYPWVGNDNPFGGTSVSMNVEGLNTSIRILAFAVPMLEEGFAHLGKHILKLLSILDGG